MASRMAAAGIKPSVRPCSDSQIRGATNRGTGTGDAEDMQRRIPPASRPFGRHSCEPCVASAGHRIAATAWNQHVQHESFLTDSPPRTVLPQRVVKATSSRCHSSPSSGAELWMPLFHVCCICCRWPRNSAWRVAFLDHGQAIINAGHLSRFHLCPPLRGKCEPIVSIKTTTRMSREGSPRVPSARRAATRKEELHAMISS